MTETETQESRKPVVNFSRPRVNTGESIPSKPEGGRLTQHDNDSQVTVKAINAFHDQSSETSSPSLPDEPRFSLDDPRTEKIPVEGTPDGSSEFVWDDRRGELVPREFAPQKAGPPVSTQDQRQPNAASERKDSEGSKSSTSRPIPASERKNSEVSKSSSSTSRPTTSSSTSTNRPGTGTAARPLKSILKHTTVTQTSERASSDEGESTGSHHTVSESGSSLVGKDGKWTSSEFDTSMLSEKEIKKLEKKGINPALYAEMKSAKKKGGSCVGSLAGNAYVS